ncbi:sensor histidine kinase [Aeromicrobium sp. CTD01-1L150]|uniref:sensor histidine kinase n=1 Tax=Aeromicrobium sp. CTD01-1L150 TaxID=3341830 RepID=UPI0035C050EC
MEVDDTRAPGDDAGPQAPGRDALRQWPWHRMADRLTFGVANASSRRDLVSGCLAVLVVGVVLWALGLTGLWPGSDHLDDWPRWSHLLTLVVAVVAVFLFRFRADVALGLGAVAVTADAALGGSAGVMVAMWELLFCVGMIGSLSLRRVVAGTVATVVALTSIVTLVAERDPSLAVVVGIQFLALLALPLWWAATLRQKSELAELAAERADLETERANLQTRRAADLEHIGELRRAEAVQGERSVIARDLHDAIASRLSTIAIQSAAALADPERDHRGAMGTVREQALEALQEMRSMIVVLRSEPDRSGTSPTDAALIGGLEQIDDLVDAARSAGLQVRLARPDREEPAGHSHFTDDVPVAVAQAVHRIVQEALTNAAKHAPASDVDVSVDNDGTEVRVVVENSFTTSAASGHPALSAGTGLITMRERAEALGGWFAAAADETAAVWRVEASLPLRRDEERADVTG